MTIYQASLHTQLNNMMYYKLCIYTPSENIKKKVSQNEMAHLMRVTMQTDKNIPYKVICFLNIKITNIANIP